MQRLGFLVASLLALSLVCASIAVAATPPTTDTEVVRNATTTFVAVNPCHAMGSDGSRLTLLMLNHITVTPSGDIASEFHVVRCH
jgi:hypothetical protein